MRIRAVWGLDIGSSALKLARVEDHGGRVTVQTYGPVALPSEGAAPDALAQGLDMLLASAGAKRSPFSASLPRPAATIKFPRLPRTTPQQTAQMVRFEAQRYIPFAIEDVVLSFQELPGHAHTEVTAQGTVDQMELLLVAVRRDTVNAYRDELTRAGQAPAHLTVSTLGLWNALRHAPPPADPGEATVVIDIGGKSSTVAAFQAGEMIFNRSAGIGGDGLTTTLMRGDDDRATAETIKRDRGVEALLHPSPDDSAVPVAAPEEAWAHSLVSELRRSLAALRGERRDVRVERLWLTGGGAKTPGLADYLESALGLPAQPLELPGLVSDPQFIEAAGVGLGALGRGVATIDLVSEEIERVKHTRRHGFQMRIAALAGAVILAGAVALGVMAMQAQQERARRVQSIQALVDRADRKLKSAQAAQEKVRVQHDMLRTAFQPAHPWLDVLMDVSDRAPRTVWLSGVDLEKGKPIAIRGTALNGQAVQTFWGNLSRSPLFAKPTLSYSNAAKVGERQVFHFGITSDVTGNAPKPVRPPKKRTRARNTGSGAAPASTDDKKGADKT